MDTIFLNSTNSKTSDLHRLLLKNYYGLLIQILHRQR